MVNRRISKNNIWRVILFFLFAEHISKIVWLVWVTINLYKIFLSLKFPREDQLYSGAFRMSITRHHLKSRFFIIWLITFWTRKIFLRVLMVLSATAFISKILTFYIQYDQYLIYDFGINLLFRLNLNMRKYKFKKKICFKIPRI